MDKQNEIELSEVEQVKFRNPEDRMTETREVFEGMSFKYPPASKEDYVNAYEEYVRRCSF